MTRRGAMRRLAAAAALACASLALPATALAQAEGPTVFTKQRNYDILTLSPIHGEAELMYRGQRDHRSQPGQPSTDQKSDRFEETLTLQTTGAVYHPNLVFLDLSGTFGLFQEQQENLGESDRNDGTLYAWDATATFLRKEDVVPTLYSRRNRETINRTFGPTLDSTTTQTGATLDIRKPNFNTRLEAYHLEEDQTALATDTGDFHLKEDVFTWHTDYHPNTHQTINWDYTYNNVSQNTGDFATAFTTHDATLAHTVSFGKEDKSSLLSSIRYFNQDGDFANNETRWEELLSLRHTDNFETHYRYTYDQQSFELNDQTTQRADAGFIHRLFKSLTTTGNAAYEHIESNDGYTTTQYTLDLESQYTKKIPWGLFTANAAVAWNKQENSSRTSVTNFTDVPQTFGDVVPIILVGPGINPNSIVVTDPSGLLVYVPGVDYNIDSFPNRVQLSRIVGGRINPGQQVLVDYQLDPQPANTTTTNFFSVGVRYDILHGPLNGLSLYARYANQNQDISSSDPTAFTPNSYTDYLYGIEYKFWVMQTGAEYEMHQGTISPFNAGRVWARLNANPSAETNFNINATYTNIDYYDEGNTVQLLMLSAQVTQRFTRQFWGTATVLWRDETTTTSGDSNGLEEQLELQWRHRQTYVYFMFRNSQISTSFEDSSYQFFELGLRREF